MSGHVANRDETDLEKVVAGLAPERGVLVGGAWTPGDLGTYDVDDPADKSVIAAVANAGAMQATAAVDAAAAAAQDWAATTRADAWRSCIAPSS